MTAEQIIYRTLKEVAYYAAHPDRTESDEFRKIKREFKNEHVKCWINNGYCDGDIETHHGVIEYAEMNGVDWEKVKTRYPLIDHVDDKDQMIEVCTRHHRGKYTGIHNMSYNIWELQAFMTDEALEKFENAVQEQLKKDKIKREGTNPSQPD